MRRAQVEDQPLLAGLVAGRKRFRAHGQGASLESGFEGLENAWQWGKSGL
jgi:hypothetical protein